MFIYLLISYLLNKRRGKRNFKVNTSVSLMLKELNAHFQVILHSKEHIYRNPQLRYTHIYYVLYTGGGECKQTQCPHRS